MSRIERPRVEAPETTDAATLNNTYDDYSQSGALNSDNTRDAAFDLVHFSNSPVMLNYKVSQLGNTGMLHSAPTSSLTATTSLSTPVHHVVQNSSGTETYMDLSADPWSLAVGDVVRVFWDLSVYPTVTGTPWNGASALGRYSVEQNPSGNITISDGLHCWAAFLEWDLVGDGSWTPVPGQGAFTDSIDTGVKGEKLANTTATTLISAWTVFDLADTFYGKVSSTGSYQEQGWFGTHGMYAYKATSANTVYGMRLVLTGLLHPAHQSVSPYSNLLMYDINVDGTLTYKGGRLSAIHMRGD